jgi:stage IV sporulation protein B
MFLESNKRKFIGLLIVFVIGIIFTSTPFQTYASLPSELRFFSGQQAQLDFSIPVSAHVTLDDPEVVQVNGQNKHSFELNLNDPISLSSTHSGQAEMNFKLFGTIPFKTMKVNVVPDLRVIPGGQTIGVKIKSKGILVVGHHLVSGSDDGKISPGEQAGIQLGDLITKINGNRINDVSKVAQYVKEAGEGQQELNLTIERDGNTISKKLRPTMDKSDQSYRLGLYIRDSAAGVGTLTFYAPDQGVYGALGHVITDLDTQTPIKVGKGEIVHSTVTSISKSQNGSPGEKRAHFFKEDKVLGDISNNTQFGIFGNMKEFPEYGRMKDSIPVAFAEEVQEGPAEILTVVEGNKVERFDIEIAHVADQDAPATKGLIIKITDKRLIDKTGGIVQGMSGSPIIQNGKMIGAVTHVFVNDPTSGYGCFIEWMLQDAGIMQKAAGANLPQHKNIQPKAS